MLVLFYNLYCKTNGSSSVLYIRNTAVMLLLFRIYVLYMAAAFPVLVGVMLMHVIFVGSLVDICMPNRIKGAQISK